MRLSELNDCDASTAFLRFRNYFLLLELHIHILLFLPLLDNILMILMLYLQSSSCLLLLLLLLFFNSILLFGP